MKKVIDKASQAVARYSYLRSVQKMASAGEFVIAHHGIQRSGTNYLLSCLDALNVKVVNRLDPVGRHPAHKHFRWYGDKRFIPDFLSKKYSNSLHAITCEELNYLARFPKNTKHIVIRKSVPGAICSLMNFGIRKKWFENKEDALGNYQVLLNDYTHYYQFWLRLAEISDQVCVVDYEEISKNSNKLVGALNALGAELPLLHKNLQFDEVRMSPKTRKQIVTLDDVIDVSSDWEASRVSQVRSQTL